MTVLNPDNKPTSLRVDEDGRLLVTGTGGGGGGSGDVLAARVDMPTSANLTSSMRSRVVDVGFGVAVGVPTGLTAGIWWLLVPPGGSMSLVPATGVSINGAEDTLSYTDPAARLVVLVKQGDTTENTFVAEVVAGHGYPTRLQYAGATTLTNTDNSCVIEADNVDLSDTYDPLFSCVVLVPDSGTLTITSGPSASINGVTDATITRTWADGNRAVAIMQRASDPTDFVVTGV